MKYHAAFKKKEILSHGTVSMNQEDMISEIKPVAKSQILYYYIHMKYQK